MSITSVCPRASPSTHNPFSIQIFTLAMIATQTLIFNRVWFGMKLNGLQPALDAAIRPLCSQIRVGVRAENSRTPAFDCSLVFGGCDIRTKSIHHPIGSVILAFFCFLTGSVIRKPHLHWSQISSFCKATRGEVNGAFCSPGGGGRVFGHCPFIGTEVYSESECNQTQTDRQTDTTHQT